MSAATKFSLVYLLAALMGMVAFTVIWRRRSAPGGKPLALMLLSAAFWAVCDAIELQVPTVADKRLVSQFQYIGVISTSPFFFQAAMELSGQSVRMHTRAMRTAVWAIPLVSLVFAWTNPWHRWLWTEILPPQGGSPFATYRYGWWFWVLTAHSYILMVAATVVLSRAMQRVGRHFRTGMALVLVSMILPWVGNAMYNLKLGPWPGLNWLTLSLGASGALLAFVVLREGLLDLLPQARGALLEMMTDGVLVLDREGRTIFVNQVARQVMELSADRLARAMGFASPQNAPDVWRSETQIGPRWLDVRIVPVPDRWGELAGRLIVARDITVQKELHQERERLIQELQDALGKVSQLEGMLPICASCRKIRDDGGYWALIEDYLGSRAPVEFTHAICPECVERLYPEISSK
jgi:PAS domain-containing protein